MTKSYFIGALSGTSLDALDLALVSIDSEGSIQQQDALSWEIPAALQSSLRELCTPGNNELVHYGTADRRFAEVVAAGVQALLARNKLAPEEIRAIGSHGQTVRHHPEQGPGFTIQLGCPHTIAALTGIDVVAQFRQKDIALGGEGAPLAPLFHREVFSHPSHDRVIANIGGIANISYLRHSGDPSSQLLGFDTGPGNTLMDDWIQRHHHQAYDIGGRWAATGTVHQGLFDTLMSDPYFSRRPPKSTGREYFTPGWLHHRLERFEQIQPEDVQATLLECTVQSLCEAIRELISGSSNSHTEIFFCGGGAHNTELLARCAVLLPECTIATTDELGIQVDWVEAVLFAWLAWCHCEGKVLDLTSVTGASRPTILGAYFPSQ
ncbi:anhydro-N-acetylmuramic acid kinase [Aliidiomarina indica]|uniref:anhydro-N-acetylmuramic acid kinase n=1 Tax=Aliidiomarina indica TaxID=2749147 RepID=UPI00189081B7|nr:anhydro-N-acetylmuramic acid kinase [Aliidiomarina indica]